MESEHEGDTEPHVEKFNDDKIQDGDINAPSSTTEEQKNSRAETQEDTNETVAAVEQTETETGEGTSLTPSEIISDVKNDPETVCKDPLTTATLAVSELYDIAKEINHIELAAICHSVNLIADDTEADISRLVESTSSGSDACSKNHQLRFYGGWAKPAEQGSQKSPRVTSSSSTSSNHRKSTWRFSAMFVPSTGSQDYEDVTDEMVIKAPITDICMVIKGDPIPPGYYRIARTPSNLKANFNTGTGGKSMYLCIKKDITGVETPIVGLTVIFPDKNETVPPGYYVVRRGTQGCNLNQGTSGERICICFKKERYGNYLTDIQLIFPGKDEGVPQSFNLIETSSSNHPANLNAGTIGVQALLAYRQILTSLECLTADEATINSNMCKFNQRRDRVPSVGSNSSSNRERSGSAASNKSGGSSSNSPPQKMNTEQTSPSSTSLTPEALFDPIGQNTSNSITGSDEVDEVDNSNDTVHNSGIGSPNSAGSASLKQHTKTAESLSSAAEYSNSLQDEQELVDALESAHFEHEDGFSVDSHDDPNSDAVINNRVITRDGIIAPKEVRQIISPLIFALYVRHGQLAEVSMKCLTNLLKESDFFAPDLKVPAGSGCVTFLDVVIEALCDRLEVTPEHQWQQSFCFIEVLIEKYKAAVSTSSLKRIINSLSFISVMGCSDQRWLDQNFSMPGPDAYTDYEAHKLIKKLITALSNMEDVTSINNLPEFSPEKKWINISVDSLDEFDEEKGVFDSSLSKNEVKADISKSSEQIVREVLCEFIDDSIDSVEIAKCSEQALTCISRSHTLTMTDNFWRKISHISTKMFVDICSRHAFLLLCTFCRGAHMNVREVGSSGYARDIGSKLIALDALAELCGNASEVLTTSKVFGYQVRRLVVPCVLFNITYVFGDARIFSKVLRIITVLWNKWRTHIKIEFAILCEQLFIRVLEASSTKVKPEFKKIALQEVQNWFDRSHILLEMFLNFDMDSKFVSHWNVLSHLTRAICTLAKRSVIMIQGSDYSIKLQQVSFLALEVVAYIAKTMMDASGHARLIQDDPEFKAKALKEGRGWEIDEVEEEQGAAKGNENGAGNVGGGENKKMQGARYRKQVNREANEILAEAIGLYKAKNNSLKKAIDFLLKKNFMADTAQEIANFLRLYKNSFDPSAIGDYLGEGGTTSEEIDYWEQVRYKFVRGVSFAQMPVEQALRIFLTGCGFRLPGESQKIDRFIDSFVKVYWQDNDKTEYCPFRHPDTVHLLSFAVIMLNTDLHRARDEGTKKKRKKMTKDEFINNLRGADQGQNIDRDILSSMYDNILASPIEMEVQSSEVIINEGSETSVKEKMENASTSVAADESKFVSDVSKGLRDAEDVLRSLSIFFHRFQITAVDVNISMDLVRFMFDAVWMNIHAVAELCLGSIDHHETCLNMALDVIISGVTAAIFLDSQMERLAFATILKNFRNLLPMRCQQVQDTSDWFDTVQNAFSGNAVQVISVLHIFVNSIREDIRAKIEIELMQKVMSRIVPKSPQLAAENISFLREDNLSKISSKGRIDLYRFFLFSDTLLYCSANMLNDAYKIHEQLPLISMTVSDHIEDDTGCSLYIKHPIKSFVVLCDDPNTKREWLRDLVRAIDDAKRRLQSHEKVVEEVRQIFLQFDPSQADKALALVMEHRGQEVSLIRSLKLEYSTINDTIDDASRISHCAPTQQEEHKTTASTASILSPLGEDADETEYANEKEKSEADMSSSSVDHRTISYPSVPIHDEVHSVYSAPEAASSTDNEKNAGVDFDIESFVDTLDNDQLEKCFSAGLMNWKTLLDDKSKLSSTSKMIYRLYGLYKQAKEGNIANNNHSDITATSPTSSAASAAAAENETIGSSDNKDDCLGGIEKECAMDDSDQGSHSKSELIRKAQMDAWRECYDMSADDAKKLFVVNLGKMIPQWNPRMCL